MVFCVISHLMNLFRRNLLVALTRFATENTPASAAFNMSLRKTISTYPNMHVATFLRRFACGPEIVRT